MVSRGVKKRTTLERGVILLCDGVGGGGLSLPGRKKKGVTEKKEDPRKERGNTIREPRVGPRKKKERKKSNKKKTSLRAKKRGGDSEDKTVRESG